jgi:hypothetical protein
MYQFALIICAVCGIAIISSVQNEKISNDMPNEHMIKLQKERNEQLVVAAGIFLILRAILMPFAIPAIATIFAAPGLVKTADVSSGLATLGVVISPLAALICLEAKY